MPTFFLATSSVIAAAAAAVAVAAGADFAGGAARGLSAATGNATDVLGDVDDEELFLLLLDVFDEDLSFFLSLPDLLDFSFLSCNN